MDGTKKFFGLFKADCLAVTGYDCSYIKQHPKPPAPPSPPPLTEGKVRGGMSSNMKITHSRPMAPPPAGNLRSRDEILEKVEQREFVIRCVAVDICPTCEYMLCNVDDNNSKVCNKCNLIFSGRTK